MWFYKADKHKVFSCTDWWKRRTPVIPDISNIRIPIYNTIQRFELLSHFMDSWYVCVCLCEEAREMSVCLIILSSYYYQLVSASFWAPVKMWYFEEQYNVFYIINLN